MSKYIVDLCDPLYHFIDSGIQFESGLKGPIGEKGEKGERGETGPPHELVGNFFGDYLYWNSQLGEWNVGSQNITLGRNAGEFSLQSRRVAIGEDAGRYHQGEESIAIGYRAGYTGQAPNSIVLNATGSTLDASSSGFFVAPIANKSTDYLLYYDINSHEITYKQILGQTQYSNPNTSIQEIQLMDNNDLSWNFIVSKIDKQVLLQMKETTTSTMDSSGSLVLSTLGVLYRPLYEVRFNGSGYIDYTHYHNLYSFIIKTDGKIEIRNIDNTVFNQGAVLTVYPTSFGYHVQ